MDLSTVIRLATALSNAASGRSVTELHLERASFIFTKICSHSISALRLSPTALTPTVPGTAELWDLSSLCAIVRALVDSYFVMYYIAVDPVGAECSRGAGGPSPDICPASSCRENLMGSAPTLSAHPDG